MLDFLKTIKLDNAEVITMSIKDKEKKKTHYYIFKSNQKVDDAEFIEIPLYVLLKEIGKGSHRHYITVAVLEDGYIMHDLNEKQQIKINDANVQLYKKEASVVNKW